MLTYALNVALILVWALIFFTGNPKKWKKRVFIGICFIQLVIISSLRYNIGFDYGMYAEGFVKIGSTGLSQLKYLDWEFGFVFYTKLISFITGDTRVYFAITAAVCLAPAMTLIYRSSKMTWLSVLLYVNLSFFYCTLNFMRQSIAIGITLFAWQFMQKRKFIPFLIIIIFASTFHISALIMLPVYFLVWFKPGATAIILYCHGLLFFYISSNGFIEIITDFFHSEYKGSVFLTDGLSLSYCVIPVVILFITLCFKRQIFTGALLGNPAKLNDSNYLINLLLISVFLMLIMSRYAILERFSYYTYIYVIILLPELICGIKSAELYLWKMKLGRWFWKVLLALTLITTTAYNFWGMYTGESGIHGVFPYRSWL